MKEQNEEQPLQQSEEWGFSDEPAYGYHPLQAFDASYELNGQTYLVEIQGFVKEDAEPSNNFRYRVTYKNGDQKVLAYLLGVGFIEEGGTQTGHAKQLAACIDKHFSEA
jgi:hypothetical protein